MQNRIGRMLLGELGGLAGDRVVGDDAAPKGWAESHVMLNGGVCAVQKEGRLLHVFSLPCLEAHRT